jgi:AraC family transcriptional regulator
MRSDNKNSVMRHSKEIQTSKPKAAAEARNTTSETSPVTAALPTPAHRADTIEAYTMAVERAVCHMKAHSGEPLDLDQLARIAGMSRFHLVRVFDELTGTTPHHFLACLRMQRAKDLLLAPGASITEVCMDVGYSSLGTFSTTFSTLVGISPQEFRAMTKRLTVKQFALAVRRFLTAGRKVRGPRLEGVVEGPSKPRGFVFVGTFAHGVPQGAPLSGTVMLKPGTFCIERPMIPEFHLLAVLIPFTAKWSAFAANLPVELVAGLRVQNQDPAKPLQLRLRLRPVRLTDPPIVLALPPLLR